MINIIRFTYISVFNYSQYSLTSWLMTSHLLIGAIMTYYSQNCPQTLTESPVGFTLFLTRMVAQWLQLLRLRSSIRRERMDLASMSDEMLLDIGIDRFAAKRESARRDMPATRKNANTA
jgi:uncharacterized protein YjiS (DUF1127 family)